ncbi:MAG: glycoside hydrolase family 2 TIM barrel-domain containing protein, partial [Clostridia bacterium]
GTFSRSVDDLYVPYVRPQDHGNHTRTRWLAISRPGGPHLRATAAALFDWTLSRYGVEQLEAARHRHDLVPEAVVHWRLDVGQHGLGSASCGPDPEPAYRWYNAARAFRFELAVC